MHQLKCIFALSFVLSFYCLSSQNTNKLPLSAIEKIQLPNLDNDALLAAEKKRQEAGEVPEFAKSHKVNINPNTHGTWESNENGIATWRIRIYSKGAKSLNFGFTKYQMPESGKLLLYTPDQKEKRGNFTAADNEEHEQLWTPIIRGEEVVIEVQLLESLKPELQLHLSYVNHDFIGFESLLSQRCHVDVVCGTEDGWGILDAYRDIIESVSLYAIRGTRVCTGFLVNNARQDCRPFYMTADHCEVTSSSAPSLVAYWNYENETCRQQNTAENGNRGSGNLQSFNTGATFRASSSSTDMTLLELDDPIADSVGVFFAAWNNSPNLPDTTICVHHPNTEEKRISFSYKSAELGSESGGLSSNGRYIIVPSWDIGSTEGGSSGAPLFNASGEVVGQLFGGRAACGNEQYDAYGRFHDSWEGEGTPSTRLKDWLDPDGLGLTRLDGHRQGDCNKDALSSNIYNQSVCKMDTAIYQIDLGTGFSDTLIFEIEGLAESISTEFQPDSAMTSTLVRIYGFENVLNTNNLFEVIVKDSVLEKRLFLKLEILGDTLENPVILSPENNAPAVSTNATFTWAENVLAAEYQIQIARDSSFSDIILERSDLLDNSWNAASLSTGIKYYWRVRARNKCATSDWSSTSSFATAVCNTYFSDDIPINISSGSPRDYTSTLNVEDQGNISDVNIIDLKGRHSWISDLTFELLSPEGTSISLIDRSCFDEQNFDIQFDDASNLTDIPCPPTDGLAYQPKEKLSDLNGEFMQGTWTLAIRDNEAQDGGSLESWGIEVCQVSALFDLSVELSKEDFLICDENEIEIDLVIGNAFSLDEIDVYLEDVPGILTTSIQANPNNPYAAKINISDLNLLADGNYTIGVRVEDELFSSKKNIVLDILSPPNVEILQPNDQTTGLDIDGGILFEWRAIGTAENYTFEFASDSLFENIISQISTTNTFLAFSDTLQPNQDYYWKITADNACGASEAVIYKFTTETIVSTKSVFNIAYKIYPNPSEGIFFVEIEQRSTQLSLYSATGKLLNAFQFDGKTSLDLSKYASGIYWIKLTGDKGTLVEKLVKD